MIRLIRNTPIVNSDPGDDAAVALARFPVFTSFPPC